MDRVPGERRRKAARLLALAIRPVAGGAAVAVAGWLGWTHLVAGDSLRVKELVVTGAARASVPELLELSPARPGDHLLSVDGAAVAAALRRHPWVDRVEVSKRWPRTLSIAVTERAPAALVELSGLYLVDARGEVFKRAVPGDGLDLPLVTGIDRDAWETRRSEVAPLLAGAVELAARWAAGGGPALSELRVDPVAGATAWTTGGLELRLGRGAVEEKLARLSQVLRAVDAEGRRALVIHLDDRRHPERVTVRFADGEEDDGEDGRSASVR